MTVTCPHCNQKVEYIENESEICSECGNELKIQPTSAQTEQYNSWDLSDKSKIMADRINADQTFSESDDECPYLRVKYNHNLFFLSNKYSVIKMELTQLDEKLQDILLFVVTDNTRTQVPFHGVLGKGRKFPISIRFNPDEITGSMLLTFYIGCKVNNKFSFFEFSVDHIVYDSKISKTNIVNQISINQSFTSNHASEINYKDAGSIGEALKEMANKDLTINEMIDTLNQRPPDYRVQNLTRTTWTPEKILINGNLYRTTKLKINYNGTSMILLNKPSILFGRDPAQVDLLVHSGGKKLLPTEYPNRTVSRKHAEILYCNDTVKLFDYSSFGTYIDGKKPDTAGILMEPDVTVEFGDIHWQMNIQYCAGQLEHGICKNCSASKVKSVTFTRKDKEPECYLLIWQCCELGRIIHDLANWTIFSRKGYFFIRTPDQKFYHLRPGDTIKSHGKIIEVEHQ